MALNARVVCTAVLLITGVGSAAYAQNSPAPAQASHVVVQADEVRFQPIEVPGFDSGMKIAVLSGDPNAETGAYVLRLAFPDGYKFPAHWHPMAENLTVLDGTFMLGMGDTADWSKQTTYKPGTFIYIPGKMPHYGSAKGATIIQLHGRSPFKIELAKPGGMR